MQKITEIDFVKRVDKGRIITAKDSETFLALTLRRSE